jgi:hypothetical protein
VKSDFLQFPSAHREDFSMTVTFDPVQKLTIIGNDARSREFRSHLVAMSIILVSTSKKPKSDRTKVTGTNPFSSIHPPPLHSLSRSQRVPVIPIWNTLPFIPVGHQNLGVT